MADYTSREAAVEAVCGDCEYNTTQDCEDCRMNRLIKLPTADVQPVVRGTWESVLLDHERMGCRPTAHYCSECLQITWFRTFFCPNCGADMRGGNVDV